MEHLSLRIYSSNITMIEDNQVVSLTIVRTRGTHGDVSVFCFAQSFGDGASLEIDFRFTPRVSQHINWNECMYVCVSADFFVWIWSCNSSLYGSQLAWGCPLFQLTRVSTSTRNQKKKKKNIYIYIYIYI